MTLELHPGFFAAHRLLSLGYQGKQQYDAAIAENQLWGNGTANQWKTDIALAQIYAASGDKEAAMKIIDVVDTNEFQGGNDYRGVALVYATLEETEKAFEWLEKSYQMHEESLCSLKIDPKLDSLRSDPRFNELLQKVRLV